MSSASSGSCYSDETPWSCHQCTYLHQGAEARFLRCGVCDAERHDEVVCKFDFKAANEHELSFKKGKLCLSYIISDAKMPSR